LRFYAASPIIYSLNFLDLDFWGVLLMQLDLLSQESSRSFVIHVYFYRKFNKMELTLPSYKVIP